MPQQYQPGQNSLCGLIQPAGQRWRAKDKMKSIEKFAIILIALTAIQVIALPALLWSISHGISTSGQIEILTTLVTTLTTVIQVSISLACAIWLYREAKQERASPWVWCMLGLTNRLVAVALFYVFMLYLKGRTNDTKPCEPAL